jgi:2-keto-4-pentenoate hydratase/2-oxohepta-3-ene-1,7-dioic acid hydratase in catechol pathway
MRFARFGRPGHEVPAVAGDGEDEVWYDLTAVTNDIDGAFLGGDGPARAGAALREGRLPRRLPHLDPDSRVGPPIARPGKIVCIGLNYRDHAAETNATVPDEPVVFMKDPRTVVGPYDTVLIPRRSTKTDWEVELGVVIGQTARYLDSPDAALAHVAGYVVSHDVSEREFQLERGGQWDKGKSCETFNPLGPWLVTPDEVGDPQAVRLRLWVNGIARQNGKATDMIFPVAHLIWYLSQFMVLYPGDLINTGTPAGVALGLADHPYLRPGDVVELSIDGLGTARQEVAAA